MAEPCEEPKDSDGGPQRTAAEGPAVSPVGGTPYPVDEPIDPEGRLEPD